MYNGHMDDAAATAAKPVGRPRKVSVEALRVVVEAVIVEINEMRKSPQECAEFRGMDVETLRARFKSIGARWWREGGLWRAGFVAGDNGHDAIPGGPRVSAEGA